jgi:hypothetical protein
VIRFAGFAIKRGAHIADAGAGEIRDLRAAGGTQILIYMTKETGTKHAIAMDVMRGQRSWFGVGTNAAAAAAAVHLLAHVTRACIALEAPGMSSGSRDFLVDKAGKAAVALRAAAAMHAHEDKIGGSGMPANATAALAVAEAALSCWMAEAPDAPAVAMQ